MKFNITFFRILCNVLLISQLCYGQKDPNTKLSDAIKAQNYNKIAEALSQGADVNKITLTGSFPLYDAIEGNNNMIVALLINKGADINKIRNNKELTELHETPLCLASNKTMAKILLLSGASKTQALALLKEQIETYSALENNNQEQICINRMNIIQQALCYLCNFPACPLCNVMYSDSLFPLQLSCDETHLVCDTCLAQRLLHHNACPICTMPITAAPIINQDFLDHILDKHCPLK